MQIFVAFSEKLNFSTLKKSAYRLMHIVEYLLLRLFKYSRAGAYFHKSFTRHTFIGERRLIAFFQRLYGIPNRNFRFTGFPADSYESRSSQLRTGTLDSINMIY